MGDKIASEGPTSPREESANAALEILRKAGASAVCILATWPDKDANGNTDQVAGYELEIAFARGYQRVKDYLRRGY